MKELKQPPIQKIYLRIDQRYILDVPYFKQQYNKSCEAASLRMALAYYGINTTDIELIRQFGYDPRYKDVVNNEWNDPREMFVGYVDTPGVADGYGVYGQPVARTAESFGRDALFKEKVTAQFLAEEIKNGHPVILWGYTSLATKPYYWNVPTGGQVKAFGGEHARTVVGVKGPVENPLGFYIHDPINGKKFEYWTTEKLMKHISAVPGVTDQAVAIK